MRRVFEIVPGLTAGRALLAGFSVTLVGGVLVAAAAVPPKIRTGLGIPFALMPLAGLLLLYVAWSMRHVRFVLTADSLRVRGDLFGRTIPRAALDPSRAQIVDLGADREHQPTLRTCGTATLGYLSGWFRLRNREKALLFVTDPARVVYVPTTRGYALIASVVNPEEFLHALQG